MRTLFPFVILSLAIASGCAGRTAIWDQGLQLGTLQVPADSLEEVRSLQSELDEQWHNRRERAALERSIELLKRLTTLVPNNAKLQTELARAYYMMSDTFLRMDGDDQARLAMFQLGIEAGEKAMMNSSRAFAKRVRAGDKVEDAVIEIPAEGQSAIYWYAANLGKFASLDGFTTLLFYKSRIYAVMQHVLSMGEEYFYGAPHRYFGVYYAKAPGFAGGDMNKSKQHFERSLAIAPNYLATKVLYAEYYAVKQEDRVLFRRLLQEVSDADPNSLPEIAAEQHFEQLKAKTLLEQTNDLF